MGLYSYSRICTFKQCPLKYRFQYIDKIKTEIETTVEAYLGSMLHRALEKLYKDVKFGKVPGLGEVIEHFLKSWSESWTDSILVVREEYTPDNYRNMGIRFLTDYYNRHKPFNQSKTIGLETTDTVKLDENHRIHIRIDRLAVRGSVYEIHDYKTGNTLPSQEELDKDPQLAIYAYGVRNKYPDAHVRLIWHFLAYDREMASERTPEQLEELRKQVLADIAVIESAKEYPAQKSALCSWCQFQPVCPHFKHMWQTKKQTEDEYLAEDGRNLVARYAELKEKESELGAELDRVRQALLLFCEKHGVDTVFGDKSIATVRCYRKLSFPKKDEPGYRDFVRTLRDTGLWEKLETVNVYELAKLINSSQVECEVIEKLEPFIRRSACTNVYLRRR